MEVCDYKSKDLLNELSLYYIFIYIHENRKNHLIILFKKWENKCPDIYMALHYQKPQGNNYAYIYIYIYFIIARSKADSGI